jgi:energy-converting hydrogenase Eha subunit F
MSAPFGDWTRHSASTTPRLAEILLAILLTILLILALAHPAGGQTDDLFPDQVSRTANDTTAAVAPRSRRTS